VFPHVVWTQYCIHKLVQLWADATTGLRALIPMFRSSATSLRDFKTLRKKSDTVKKSPVNLHLNIINSFVVLVGVGACVLFFPPGGGGGGL
jgi:hypothetical protein